MCVRWHREPRHLSARRDRQPPISGRSAAAPSTSPRSPAPATSSGPKQFIGSAPARFWWIDDPALLAEAREEQDRRYQSDAWDDLIEHWLTHEIRTVSDGFPDYGNSRTESGAAAPSH